MRLPRSILLLALASLLPAARAADTPLFFGLETPDIPIIHTGKELQKLKPLTEDQPLRIGIECKTCQLGQGALIYIAPDAHANPVRKSHFNDWQHSEAGPVSIEVRRILAPGEHEHAVDLVTDMIKEIEEMQRIDIKNPLYLGVVQPPEAGKYEIRILSNDGNLLAKTTLTVSDKQAQPWFSFQADSIDPKSRKPFNASLTGKLARPKWPDLAFETPAGALPRLLPEEPLPGFEIASTGNVLTVSSKFPMTNNTEDNFLARFWINDKPVLTSELEVENAEAISRSVEEFKPPFKFKLALDLATLDAKPGDRVTVQLAYSPCGLEPIELANVARELRAEADSGDSGQILVLVSNKTTFTLPAPQKTKIKN